MFIHNFKYFLKILFRNKSLIFWTFIFPIILGTFFHLAFKDIESNESFHVFDVAIIDSEDYENNIFFKETINKMSQDKENKLFNAKVLNKKEASKLLENKEITGYLEFNNDDVNITVNDNGIYETILKFFVDEVNSNKKIIENTVNNEISKGNVDYQMIINDVMEKLNAEVELKNISRNNLSYTMIEYYTLIAMAALYGGAISMYVINKNMPNLSSVGKRNSAAPIKKETLILSGLLASLIVQITGLVLLFIYTIFILKINYNSNIVLIALLAFVGSLAGLSLGCLIATTLKANENAKNGILIGITMFLSFLSGMMGITMKYVIDKNVPILNMINPAAMITDGLYALYYYGAESRYIFNILSLLIFSSLMLFVSSISLRRQKYDSI